MPDAATRRRTTTTRALSAALALTITAACQRAVHPVDAGVPQADGGKAVTPALAPPPVVVRRLSGRLSRYVRRLGKMGLQSRRYRAPNERERALVRTAFDELLRGHLRAAAAGLATVGLEVVDLRDRRARYWLVHEPQQRPPRGWGFYAINIQPRRPYIFQAPHSINDRFTDRQAARLMEQLGAFALLVSTSYRCATPVASPCSGRTPACGDKRRRTRYRISDMAHAETSVFQIAHEVIYGSSPDAVVVQLHGFDRRPGRTMHYSISDGTRRRGGRRRLSNRLAGLLRPSLGAGLVVSCNERLSAALPTLCGTQSIQGRHVNGSPDPCRVRALTSRNRFIHLEQSWDARRPGGQVEPRGLRRALARLRPRNKTPAPPSR